MKENISIERHMIRMILPCIINAYVINVMIYMYMQVRKIILTYQGELILRLEAPRLKHLLNTRYPVLIQYTADLMSYPWSTVKNAYFKDLFVFRRGFRGGAPGARPLFALICKIKNKFVPPGST